MFNAIILIRDSTKDQNPELQLSDCLSFADSNNFNVVKIFKKNISAYKNEFVWSDEIDWAISHNVKNIIVWNIDRFSRRPEEEVLDKVKTLSLLHGIKIFAVKGDEWSNLLSSIGSLKDSGFVGKAILEFLETLLRGLEHQRAHRESKVKSDRVKLAIRKKNDVTVSYKGNKWGRKSLPKQTINKILELRKNPNMSLRDIQKQVWVYDVHGNKKKNVSLGKIQEIVKNNEW